MDDLRATSTFSSSPQPYAVRYIVGMQTPKDPNALYDTWP
jgi:hypothetical protein